MRTLFAGLSFEVGRGFEHGQGRRQEELGTVGVLERLGGTGAFGLGWGFNELEAVEARFSLEQLDELNPVVVHDLVDCLELAAALAQEGKGVGALGTSQLALNLVGEGLEGLLIWVKIEHLGDVSVAYLDPHCANLRLN